MVDNNSYKAEDKKGFKYSKPCKFGQNCEYNRRGVCAYTHEATIEPGLIELTAKVFAFINNEPPKNDNNQ